MTNWIGFVERFWRQIENLTCNVIAAVGFPLLTSLMNFLSSCLEGSSLWLKYWLLWCKGALSCVLCQSLNILALYCLISGSSKVGNISGPHKTTLHSKNWLQIWVSLPSRAAYLHSLTRLDISSVTWMLLPWKSTFKLLLQILALPSAFPLSSKPPLCPWILQNKPKQAWKFEFHLLNQN